MSLSPLVSFKSQFVTYLLNFPRTMITKKREPKEHERKILLVRKEDHVKCKKYYCINGSSNV